MPYLPQLISQALNLVMDDLLHHLVETGHGDLRPTHCLNVFRFMDCDGTRPSELARRAGMTPQAMSELVGYLERCDYVRRVPDPSDGRGRIVVYADRGTHAAEVATTFFADMDVRWGDIVGRDRLQDVKSALADILGASSPHGADTPKASVL
ncbi:winged helix DNA-binding protein [Streptosporangium album]